MTTHFNSKISGITSAFAFCKGGGGPFTIRGVTFQWHSCYCIVTRGSVYYIVN